MSKFIYFTPLDVATGFRTISDVAICVDYLTDKATRFSQGKGDDFVPPIVHSALGRCFNVDYNFLINCVADLFDEPAVKGDFMLTEASGGVMKNGMFLIAGILEGYYGVVRINSRKVQIGKYRNNNSIELKSKFYNVVLIKNGENVKKLSAVPFSESEIKKLISSESFAKLENLSKNANLEQVAFGLADAQKYAETNQIEIENIFN